MLTLTEWLENKDELGPCAQGHARMCTCVIQRFSFTTIFGLIQVELIAYLREEDREKINIYWGITHSDI